MPLSKPAHAGSTSTIPARGTANLPIRRFTARVLTIFRPMQGLQYSGPSGLIPIRCRKSRQPRQPYPTTQEIAISTHDLLTKRTIVVTATRNRPAEWQQSFLKARAISREQRPDDLVGTALYLLSDLAGFVSGQTIVVDGGHIMY